MENNQFVFIGEDYWQTPDVTELTKALVAFHAELKPIKRDRKVPVGKAEYGNTRQYATLDVILEISLPLLAKHSLTVMQTITSNALMTVIFHPSGQQIGSRWALNEVWVGQNTNALQNLGGTFSYLKRYAFCAALGISADDDDDGATSKAKATPKPATQKQNRINQPDKKELTIEQLMAPKAFNKILAKLKAGKTHEEIIEMYGTVFEMKPPAIAYIWNIRADDELQDETITD